VEKLEMNPAFRRGKRVLVTGASGFVGTQAVPLLQAAGFEVHAVSSRPRPAAVGVRWHQVDLLDQGAAARVVANVHPSHLLHLAWYAEPRKYWTHPINVRWVEASIGLVRAFREAGGQRAVMAGSCAEYDWHSGPCREQATPLQPELTYGQCKHALQVLLDAYSKVTGLSSAWGRIFFIYGPGEPAQRLVPSVICSLLSNAPAQCTAGQQERDFLHVQDAARALVMLLESKHQGPINITSGHATPVKEVVSEIARQMQRTELLRLGVLKSAENDPQSISGDPGTLMRLGWSPQYNLTDGISQTIEWWKRRLEKS
jgi:nucleoside-diphosphate-sugar epimerase